MIRKRLKLLSYLLLLLSPAAVLAAPLFPKADPVPGGIAVVPLEPITQSAPSVYYGKRRVLIRQNTQYWEAVVGIPLSAEVGVHQLRVETANGKTYSRDFSVAAKDYATQHITLKNKRMVNPYAKDLERIRNEKKIILKALATWSDNPDVQTRFILPVDGELGSPFGLRRFFNGQPRRPHSGVDIAAPEGTLIRSPADGIVVNTGNYFFNGNSVFVDHGQGLVTMFCHLSDIDVKTGTVVKQGDVLGKVGMTGRVTGPHLHWSVSLNNTRVEPMLFMTPAQDTGPTPQASVQ
ncbi:MAG: peptidoglycan DD-metalloendopeptidase family protein [Gammaproteobacteria bacterium]|jgi:murein DD-endopeptidase MepM/ murein hydrolase activator NlpD